jgi:ketosteroid isomerase-like protein
MACENVEVVRRLLVAFNRGDLVALDELDERAELQDEPRIPGAGWNYGHDGAVHWARKLRQSFGELSFAIDDPTEAGASVVTGWRAEGEGKRSGARVAMGGYCVFDLEGGKVRRVEFFESRGGAMEAALARRP